MTRVLVVDDEPQILRALRINLHARQYDVVTAGSGREPSWQRPRLTQTSSFSISACLTWTAWTSSARFASGHRYPS